MQVRVYFQIHSGQTEASFRGNCPALVFVLVRKAHGLCLAVMNRIRMKPEENRPYDKLSPEELQKAQATACQFLEENSAQISDTMRAKLRFLETLIQRLSVKKTSFEDRLEYFARIAEIARLIEEDANGFFQLASQPVVARILGTVPQK